MAALIPVVLCGGSGSRLWPLSRSGRPKQLLPLASARSMLQETIARTALFDEVAPAIVICNEAHRFFVAGQLEAMEAAFELVLEPEGRNTAPAVALAALRAQATGQEDAALLVLPADHLIRDPAALVTAVADCLPAVQGGQLAPSASCPRRLKPVMAISGPRVTQWSGRSRNSSKSRTRRRPRSM